MNIPEDIKEKILLMANAYANVPGFANEYRYDLKKAMDFSEGAMKGYSLALPELEEKDKEITRLNARIEELEKLITLKQD